MSDQNDNGGDDNSPPAEREYEVGYCKPPKHGQIKKGEIRNPNGRPKHSKGLRTVLKEAMAEKLIAKVDGKPKKMSNQTALVKGLIVDALKGDHRSRAKLIDMNMRLLPDEGDPNASKKLAEEDQAILAAFLKRRMDEEPSDDQ